MITNLYQIDVCYELLQINVDKCDYFQKVPNVTMVDTVHVKRNMERNQHLGISDFYLALGDNGIATVAGIFTLEF